MVSIYIISERSENRIAVIALFKAGKSARNIFN